MKIKNPKNIIFRVFYFHSVNILNLHATVSQKIAPQEVLSQAILQESIVPAISFRTGTSWGTFVILIPIGVSFSNAQFTRSLMISIETKRNISSAFNTKSMYRASKANSQATSVAIFKDD